jgi:hypothetical protein
MAGHGEAGAAAKLPVHLVVVCGEAEPAMRWPLAMALSMGGGCRPVKEIGGQGEQGGARGGVEEAAVWWWRRRGDSRRRSKGRGGGEKQDCRAMP